MLCLIAEKVNLFACEVTGEVVQCLGPFLKHGSAVVKKVRWELNSSTIGAAAVPRTAHTR